MNNKITIPKGFTLVELLVVIGIFIVLAVSSIPIYGNWQVIVQADSAVDEIAQVLEIARARSISGLNNSAHGVYFDINEDDNDKYVLYQGSSYATRDQNFDREVTLGSSLIMTTNIVGNEVNFFQGLGLPAAIGTIIIAYNTTDETATITINSLGVIE